MKKEEDYYTEPTEQQRVKLKRYWIIDKVAALEYFKQIYNLTALNKKKYRYTDRDEENDRDDDEVNYRDEDEIYKDELPF